MLALAFVAASALRSADGPLNPDAQRKADSILTFLLNGTGRGQTWDKLATFVDTVGSRVSGSQALDNAVAYMLDALTRDGLENVHGEEVTIPKWVRGNEYAQMISPRAKPLAMLGLGTSVGTGPQGITAPVVVVASFADLRQRAARNETQGKIVVYNQYCDWAAQPVGCYGESVVYRSSGASEASKAGAVAALVRSVASFSIDSPHTGIQTYASGVRPIPVACISIEDAELLARMQGRGVQPVVKVYMEAQNLDPVTSHNVVAEWTGSTHPDEVVIVSGHLDSWDVGQGAMDDGGGAVAAWQVLSAARQLGLRPTRTLRLVMWSCEEFGGVGAQQYFARHRGEADKLSLAFESDMGTFIPYGIQFTGSSAAQAIMQQVVALLAPINATQLLPDGAETDTGPWAEIGVPVASLATHNDKYFYFHHSHGDTMTIYPPGMLDLAAAAYAVAAFTVADMPALLPR